MDSSPPLRPRSRDDFQVAIICALPCEYEAVIAVLDGCWNNFGDIYGKVEGDWNTYTTGWIGQHNVVLTLSSQIGKVNATSSAMSCSLSFSKVEIAFLVGVCGAVPQTVDNIPIVLGDVIVSDGEQIVEYDFGRRYSDKLRLKSKLASGFVHSHNIRRYLTTMQTDHYHKLVSDRATKFLREVQEGYSTKYRSPQEDRLFSSDRRHKHPASAGCEICNRCTAFLHPVCDTALGSTCESLGCDETKSVCRRSKVDGGLRIPNVHWGAIASADTVMRSAVDRDQIAREHNVIAFEMEGAGACHIFPCLIVKGVCDYADSHKNKQWQNYAAITAACVTKALLKWYTKADQRLNKALSISKGRRTPMQAAVLLRKKSKLNVLYRRENQALSIHEYIAKLQQQNEDFQLLTDQLKAQVYERQGIPPQVPPNLVAVNDALGETYSFSLTFIDTLELFVTILKHKFQDVGVRKIEQGEWLLHNHRTGHVLDLERPWKIVVKPGQMLDMSMVFSKPNMKPNQCPWCDNENESDQLVACQNCFGEYRRIEEIFDIVGMQGDDNAGPKNNVKEDSLGSMPQVSIQQQGPGEDKDEDIHMFTRVQIRDLKFRIARLANADKEIREHQITVTHQDLKDINRLAQSLSKSHRFPEQACRTVFEEFHDELIILTREHLGDIESEITALEESFPGDTKTAVAVPSTERVSELPIPQKLRIESEITTFKGYFPGYTNTAVAMPSHTYPRYDMVSYTKNAFAVPSHAYPRYDMVSYTKNALAVPSTKCEVKPPIPQMLWICHRCNSPWHTYYYDQCYNCNHKQCNGCPIVFR